MDDLNFGFLWSGQSIHLGSIKRSIHAPIGTDKEAFGFELRHISLAKPGDIVILRKGNIPKDYIDYHEKLIGGKINIVEVPENKHDITLSLSELLIRSKKSISETRSLIKSNAILQVFNQTFNEQKVADLLGIPLWGNYKINYLYGHKSGGRRLANKCNILMPPGKSVNNSNEAFKYLDELKKMGHKSAIVKYDESYGGMGHLKIDNLNKIDISDLENFMSHKQNIGEKFVVEAWIPSVKSIGCHIEINRQKLMAISAVWEQRITNNVSYGGAIPLKLDKENYDKLMVYLKSLGEALIKKEAVGSFGPDFMIGQDGNLYFNELNARIPTTAFALQIMKLVKGDGKIRNGFFTTNLPVNPKKTFNEIREVLSSKKILCESPGNNGIVPFHIGMLPFGKIYFVCIADNESEANRYYSKAKQIFSEI